MVMRNTTAARVTGLSWRSQWATLLALVPTLTFFWAILCNVVLDMSTMPFQPKARWYAVIEHPKESLVSSILIWLAIILLVCITYRLWLSCAISLSVCILVSAASVAKYRVRDEPLYPSDLFFLWQPTFLLDMVSAGWLVVAVSGIGALVVGFLLVGRGIARRFPRVRRSADPRAWTKILGLRVVVALVSALILLQVPDFNTTDNRVRATYEAAGAEWILWRQAENYVANGFLAGFLFNTLAEAMEKPEGYGRAAMEEIAKRFERRADQLNVGRKTDAFVDVNVVLLLSEAFSDPERLIGVELAEDPMPFVRKTMAKSPSGQAVVSASGGGTADVEFEVLTGMSQTLFAPQMTTPYQMLVPSYDQFPSAAWNFADRGHATMAVHPYLRSMYRRGAAYPRLGFDTFLDVTRLKGLSTIGKHWAPSDESTFREVLRLTRNSDKALFVNLITVQNHFPYEDWYDDPIENSLRSDALAQYARGLAHADTATERFLTGLRRSGEKALVVFYGDHLPGGVYNPDVVRANWERRMETPFFIWSNYLQLPATRLPATSPMYFMPLAFEAAGARLPPYYALLLDLHAEIPNLSLSQPLDPSRLSARAQALLGDLRLVQYDFSVGERYVTDEMFHSLP